MGRFSLACAEKSVQWHRVVAKHSRIASAATEALRATERASRGKGSAIADVGALVRFSCVDGLCGARSCNLVQIVRGHLFFGRQLKSDPPSRRTGAVLASVRGCLGHGALGVHRTVTYGRQLKSDPLRMTSGGD